MANKWRLGLFTAMLVATLAGVMALATDPPAALAMPTPGPPPSGPVTEPPKSSTSKSDPCPSGQKADANGTCVKVNSGATTEKETCSKPTFFGLEPWYEYLPLKAKSADRGKSTYCEVASFKLLGTHSSILLIALAIVDDLLRIAGMVAIIFIIVGGFQFITSQGSPDGSTKGRTTIINALIGLVIAILAVSLVSFIGHKFGA